MNVIHGESLSISNSTSSTLSNLVHFDDHIRELLFVDDLALGRSASLVFFFLELGHFENDFSSIFTTNYVMELQNPLQHSDSELNLERIKRMVPIDISVNPAITENIHIGSFCTDDEIQNYKALFQEFREVFS